MLISRLRTRRWLPAGMPIGGRYRGRSGGGMSAVSESDGGVGVIEDREVGLMQRTTADDPYGFARRDHDVELVDWRVPVSGNAPPITSAERR